MVSSALDLNHHLSGCDYYAIVADVYGYPFSYIRAIFPNYYFCKDYLDDCILRGVPTSAWHICKVSEIDSLFTLAAEVLINE